MNDLAHPLRRKTDRSHAAPDGDDRPRNASGGAAADAQHAVRRWLAVSLDEVDYGIVLVMLDGTVLYANHTARIQLDDPLGLRLDQGRVCGLHPSDSDKLHDAMRAASHQGLRRLLCLGHGERMVSVSVIPLSHRHGDDTAPVLLMLGKQQVCEPLSAHWYGVSHGLTVAERSVLERLLEGLDPNDIAGAHQVAVSTVRSQVAALRAKTANGSIMDLVRKLAMLPPVVTSLRSAGARHGSRAEAAQRAPIGASLPATR